MKNLKLGKKEKKWQIYHRFERKEKARFLRRISTSDGFRILNDLYEFTSHTGIRKDIPRTAMDKVKTLAGIHSIFSKVR